MSDLSRLVAAFVVGAGVAASGLFVGGGLERFRMADRSIAVKGLAEQDVEADFAVWTLGFRRAGNEFGAVQQALSADREKVLAFLKSRGFKDEEMESRPVLVQDLLARDYAQGNVAFRFNGSGQVVVRSPRVADVAQAALALDPLIQAGVQIGGEGEGPSGPRYQLRGFNEGVLTLMAIAAIASDNLGHGDHARTIRHY